MNVYRYILLAISAVAMGLNANALQADSLIIINDDDPLPDTPAEYTVPESLRQLLTGERPVTIPDTLSAPLIDIDSIPLDPADTLIIDVTRYFVTMPKQRVNIPIIYDSYEIPPTLTLADGGDDSMGYHQRRLYELFMSDKLYRIARTAFIVNHPDQVRYNTRSMPTPPKHYRAVIAPGGGRVNIEEIKLAPGDPANTIGSEIKKKHWIHRFDASLQFSQAYVSPNWYQGGKNNTNLVGNVLWNVKINDKLHPNLMFDTTIQYKVGVNSAPDDTIRSYNLSEDLFQANTRFGLKAAKYWYYSVNAELKTQVLNHYPTNSRNLQASFMSPGQFNLGLGMTYNRSTKVTTIGLSISPLSYNMKTCLDKKMNETSFGIKEGHKTLSQYGSNVELNFNWKLRYNINYTTRVFGFTNYEYVQADWQNTINFNVTTYLQTRLFWNVRFDTQTKRLADSKWHRYQFKELLSFGLTYSFKSA